MIIILKESEVFRDGNYSREDAELILEERFANLFMNPLIENVTDKGKASHYAKYINKNLKIEDVNSVKVVIIKGE